MKYANRDVRPKRRKLFPRLHFPAVLLGFLAGAIAVPAAAQQKVFVPDARANQGPVNLVPLGGKSRGAYQDIRAQIRVPAKFFAAGSTITDIGFAAASTGTYSYREIEVVLAHLAGNALGKVLDKNLANAVTVLKASGFRYALPRADEFHMVGLSSRFTHDGKRDLVVDFTMQDAFFSGNSPGSRRSSTLDTVFSLAYDPAKLPRLDAHGPFASGAKLAFQLAGKGVVYFGVGCKASRPRAPSLRLDGTPTLGKTLGIALSDAVPSAPALLLTGSSDTMFGPIKLPFGLAALGAPGCTLYTDILVIAPAAASAAGRAAWRIPFPADKALKGLLLFHQGSTVDGQLNGLGLAFSGAVRAVLQE